MAFENITENKWDPKGDYCQEFLDETQRKVDEIDDLLDKVREHKQSLTNNSDNTKTVDNTLNSYNLLEKRLTAIKKGLQSRKSNFIAYEN